MAAAAVVAEKPAVLIIGGLGYVGRFLALHIHDNSLASEVRLVDKMLPQLAWLAPEFKEACSEEKFMQADASKESSLSRIFGRKNGKQWDYVFNCGGETRFSQDDETYRSRSLALSLAVGKESAKRGVKVYVELSTGAVYKSGLRPSKEDDKAKPWNRVAAFKLQAENELADIEGLSLVIARTAYIYGDYASKFVGCFLPLARVHQHLDESLKWLWTKDLRANTVHIKDVTRALWSMVDWYAVQGKPGWDEKTMGKIPIFNIVDKGDTTQGDIAEIVGKIFNIKTGFHGGTISNFARFNMGKVVNDLNEKNLSPWAELLEDAGITRPIPLTPFMEKELLKEESMNMDGSRIEEILHFKHEYPRITEELVRSVIDSYKRMGWWPE